MKLSIKQVYEVVGVLAIVVSLLFVALELRQANNIAQAAAEAQMREISTTANQIMMESPEFAATISKLRTWPDEELSAAELESARAYYINMIATLSTAQQFWERGLLSDYTYSIFYNLPESTMRDRPGSIPIFAELVDFYGFTKGTNPMWDSLLSALQKMNQSFEI